MLSGVVVEIKVRIDRRPEPLLVPVLGPHLDFVPFPPGKMTSYLWRVDLISNRYLDL